MDSFGGKVQMVFQDPYASLNPCLTVRQALSEALDAAVRLNGHDAGDADVRAAGHRLTEQEKEERIRKILALTGLSYDDADRYPHAFSGGQRQRIGDFLAGCDHAGADLGTDLPGPEKDRIRLPVHFP